MPGTLFVVATPIGNLEDITVRAVRVLKEATVIAAEDTRRTAHLLTRYSITTPTISLHEHNEQQKAASLVARLERGEDIALVSDAGTPTISDPGRRFIQAAIAAGVRVEPIPGPNAAIAALAVSGFSIDNFCFMGFPPVKSKDRTEWFDRVRAIGGTVVFYEAPHRIRETLEQFQRLVGDCEVMVGRELTKVHESLVRGPISTVLPLITAKGELTIVANVGQSTENDRPASTTDEDLFHELCHMTEKLKASRRTAIGRLAKRHNIPANEVYARIERAKKSGF